MHNNINVNVGGPVQASSTYRTVVLKGNIPFAEQISDPNTKYVIKWDFDLGGESVTIPENCVLEFDGGSLSNGTLVGNGTCIGAELTKIFNTDITLAGTWNIEALIPDWVKNNNDSIKIQWCLDHGYLCQKVMLNNRQYVIDRELVAKYNLHLTGSGAVSNFHILEPHKLNGTVIKTTATSGSMLYLTFDNNQYNAGGCVIENIAFYGVGGEGNRSDGINFKPNDAPNRNIVIRNCVIASCDKGIRTDSSSDKLTNCTIEFSGLYVNWCKYGIYSDRLNQWVGLHIHDCTIEGNDTANIYLYHSGIPVCTQNLIIENNLLEYSPIGFKISARNCNVRIEGNYFEGETSNFITSIGQELRDNIVCKILNNYHVFGNLSYEIKDGWFEVNEIADGKYIVSGQTRILKSNIPLTLNTSSAVIVNNDNDFEKGYEEYTANILYNPDWQTLLNTTKYGKGIGLPMGYISGEARGELSGSVGDRVFVFVPYYRESEGVNGIFVKLRNINGAEVVNQWFPLKLEKGFHIATIVCYATAAFNSTICGVTLTNPNNETLYGVPLMGNFGTIEDVNAKCIPYQFIYRKGIINNWTLTLDTKSSGFWYINNRNSLCMWDGTKWIIVGDLYGTHESMPAANTVDIGTRFFNTTFNKPVYSNGTKWVESDKATAFIPRSGITANRPQGRNIYVGFMYFDTSISPARPIYASAISDNTVTWVDATGATV